MSISTFVYKRFLASSGIRRKVWYLTRLALIRLFKDPACSLPIQGQNLKLPLSHPLPSYLQSFPFYDRLPQRISDYIHDKYEHINCIDIGANIGDTIAAFYKNETDTFLAIEPNPKFNRFLSDNWGWNKNVTIISDICSSVSSESKFVIHDKNGTGSARRSEYGVKMKSRTLDEIIDDHPFVAKANILKIDTDGHDFEIMGGATRLLSQSHPALLFECDVFENTNYAQDCIQTLSLIKQAGYGHFLLYSNVGSFMGIYSLSDLSPFRNLLFYQLTSNFRYFDILVMRDEDLFEFYKREANHFVDNMPDKSLQHTAMTCLEL